MVLSPFLTKNTHETLDEEQSDSYTSTLQGSGSQVARE